MVDPGAQAQIDDLAGRLAYLEAGFGGTMPTGPNITYAQLISKVLENEVTLNDLVDEMDNF